MDKAHALKLFKHKIVPSLWHDCDALYARDPKSYIALQDTYQLNVNLLLLAQWLDNLHIDHQSLTLNTAIWSELNSKIQTHDQNTLIPFRQHRRASKSSLSKSQYQHMLKKELQLERQTQQFILTELDASLQDPNSIHIRFISTQNSQYTHRDHASNADTYLNLFR